MVMGLLAAQHRVARHTCAEPSCWWVTVKVGLFVFDRAGGGGGPVSRRMRCRYTGCGCVCVCVCARWQSHGGAEVDEDVEPRARLDLVSWMAATDGSCAQGSVTGTDGDIGQQCGKNVTTLSVTSYVAGPPSNGLLDSGGLITSAYVEPQRRALVFGKHMPHTGVRIPMLPAHAQHPGQK